MGIDRLAKLRPVIAQQELDALLVSKRENCRYISCFSGEGHLLISPDRAVLATDFRYLEQAKKEAPGFNITPIKGDLARWLPALASQFGWRKLGFEANTLTFTTYGQLNEKITAAQIKLELIPTTDLVEDLRSVKEEGELKLITKAVELTDAAFRRAKSGIRPGVTEKQAAWEIEKYLRESGSDGIAFDIIVASGPNSALPHARPTERVIRPGEPVIIDMGARLDGYCSDFSRTLCFGKATQTFGEIYNIVLKAQLTAVGGIRTGMKAGEVDWLARNVIEQAGHGDAFGHGLGHGVGLETHESPAIGPASPDSLADGMVFTVEPGIYLPGWGGVRIEDMVSLKEGRVRVLTRVEKEMEAIK